MSVPDGHPGALKGLSTMKTEMTAHADGLTAAEVEALEVEQLPDREQMSLINANVAAPINAAVALNALSDNSVAYANATQNAPITQSN